MKRLFAVFLACSGAPTTEEKQAYIDEHNSYRCVHGKPALTWDNALSKRAAAWAEKRLNGDKGETSGDKAGENNEHAAGIKSSVDAIVDAVQGWYSAIQYCATESCKEGKNGRPIESFTQMLGEETTKFGCGHAKGDSHKFGEEIFISCQYSPKSSGNGISTETVSSKGSCGGEEDLGMLGSGNSSVGGGMSGGIIALIVCGVVGALVAFIGVAYYFGKGKKPPAPKAPTPDVSKIKQPSVATAKRKVSKAASTGAAVPASTVAGAAVPASTVPAA